ncbi:hypothetical protein DMC64_41995 [Amycolatopsis sp. WAC 04197]|uniref:hypothetical protein n=1 Tax=Amycolatopsis sp. WAC 04197 TaxID=2203199 RepID=UPI000F78C939|nr:hypothetical protein [Amycolatopsis sp. WAC 04197]RSN38641.1 hypothetical protein DMC64_41995 [Amycolatopsis sp. WAC 04197]
MQEPQGRDDVVAISTVEGDVVEIHGDTKIWITYDRNVIETHTACVAIGDLIWHGFGGGVEPFVFAERNLAEDGGPASLATFINNLPVSSVEDQRWGEIGRVTFSRPQVDDD